jgi:hypothetical protein
MKISASVIVLLLTVLLLPLTVGCRSTKASKAQKRTERIQPNMSINEVYKVLGKPRETFAAVYAWEYALPTRTRGSNQLYRVEFEERNGRWIVRSAQWK